MVRVGLVQLAVSTAEPVATRIERTLDLTGQVARSTDVVVLPELWPTGAFDTEAGLANAEPLDGPLVASLSRLAAANGCWLHGGSFVELGDAGQFYNTSVVFGPDGSLAASYRKIHLFGFDAYEAATFTPGDQPVVVKTPLGTTGLATCYDLRFPELFRALVDLGATAVLTASGWPTARIKRWTILAQARSMENQLWFVGCNETGQQGSTELGGRSIVTDPWGDIVAACDGSEQVLTVDLDPTTPETVRSEFPVLRDRRIGTVP